MSVEDHTVSFSLEVNVEAAYEDLRRLETILYRSLALMRRFGLPEEVDDAIFKIQRLIAMINMLRLTIAAFQATMGPIGWALAFVGAAGTALTVAETSVELGRPYG